MRTKIRCACCGFRIIEINSITDICPVCFWQKDDFQEEHDCDAGGPNGASLRVAKENYIQFGASEREFIQYVRLSLKEEN